MGPSGISRNHQDPDWCLEFVFFENFQKKILKTIKGSTAEAVNYITGGGGGGCCHVGSEKGLKQNK